MSAIHNAQPGKAIDPARIGVSKTAVVATDLCERKGWYGENIRDIDGRRIRHLMPERVHFGKALDVAVEALLWRFARADGGVDIERPLEMGLESYLSNEFSDTRLPSKDVKDELWNALEQLTGDIARDEFGRSTIMLDGTLIDFTGALFQGLDGESLAVDLDDFMGKEGTQRFIGTPDFILPSPHGDTILDLKSAARARTTTFSSEMGFYSWLATAMGRRVARVGYIVWLRQKSPRWSVLIEPATSGLLDLGYRHAMRTARVASSDLEQVGWHTTLCGSCEWKRPVDGFGGCEIGQLIDVAAAEKKEA